MSFKALNDEEMVFMRSGAPPVPKLGADWATVYERLLATLDERQAAAAASEKRLLELLVGKTRTIDRVRRQLRRIATAGCPAGTDGELDRLADSLDKRVINKSPRNTRRGRAA